ncbi:predicted protein [Streptomyces sp. C]|nr:predicted protein [Streptomyces sp. C]
MGCHQHPDPPERLKATGKTTMAKAYRLLKAIVQTAVEDELVRRNPCSIRGAGREDADERPVGASRGAGPADLPPTGTGRMVVPSPPASGPGFSGEVILARGTSPT